MYHVHGHLDRFLTYEEMNPSKRLNCQCDELAGVALSTAIEQQVFIDRVLPDEDLVVLLDGNKVSGLYEKTILRNWGDKQARLHYHDNGIIPLELFEEVY